MWIPDFVLKIAGRKIAKKMNLQEGNVEIKKWYQSRTIWVAIITSVIGITQAVGQATGHPIEIPSWVYSILGSMGLYTARTSSKPIE